MSDTPSSEHAGEGRGPRAYRYIVGMFSVMCGAFFRRVSVLGVDNIPKEGGGIVISWHPNGLIDPGLVLVSFPRQLVFGARHGIFKFPLLGTLMRQIGTVPIYRATDLPGMSKEERRKKNQQSLDALAGEIARGSFSALFPEGVSHDAPHLMEMKSGAARLFSRALELQNAGTPPAVMLPVGLHYDDKDMFRSNALVEFHPPIELTSDLLPSPDADEDERREKARRFTEEIERVLRDVVLATESWELHRLMHRARKLIRAERAHRAGANPGKTRIDERVLGFARIRAGYYARLDTHPEEVAALVARVDEYDAELRALQLEDHELDHPPQLVSARLVSLLVLQAVCVFFLLPPALVLGAVINAPIAVLLIGIAAVAGKYKKDEATIKLLVGAMLFPLAWLGVGLFSAWEYVQLRALYPSLPNSAWLVGITCAMLTAIGGAASVRYLRVSREVARALRVRLTRTTSTRHIDDARKERAALHDALIGMAAGLELPGDVADDGRIVAKRDDKADDDKADDDRADEDAS